MRTPGIREDWPESGVREHRYGLSVGRWTRLQGRRYWVTGAGTGYGRAVARALVQAGAGVCASGRRRPLLEATRDALLDEVEGAGSVEVLPGDLGEPEKVSDLVRRIREGGALHGVVHCAARPPHPLEFPLEDVSIEAWADFLRINLWSPWCVVRETLPLLREAGEARIVLFSSRAGWNATPGFGPYNLSKAAVNILGASWGEELAARNPTFDVQCNVLEPGEARTEMNQGSTVSPGAVVPMVLGLLAHPPGGPNGRIFARDGRHLAFGDVSPWHRPLLGDSEEG